jgi:8-oxo-dGTP pyrophosphatase MutT (NUDIX family)
MECINCGIVGHSFRECSAPVSSFGILALREAPAPAAAAPAAAPAAEGKEVHNVQVLMIRRRDSLGYVEFLRGRYSLATTDFIQRLINQMTADEHRRLLTQSFDDLWNILWNYQNTRQYRNEYEHAKQLFERLKSSGRLAEYIRDCTTSWTEPEWGFPKGRRSHHESEFRTAVREFREETGWSHPFPACSVDVAPETELYTGSNGIMYRQVYYIGMCQIERSDVSINPSNHVQIREVSAVAWCTLDDAIAKIRPTSPEKRLIVESIRTRWSTICSVHARADISLRHTEDVRTRSSHRGGGPGEASGTTL